MTEKLYDKDSFIKEFSANVLSCRDIGGKYETVLDKTAFFPEGGGQGSDRGFIGNTEIFDVQEKDGIIYHYSENPVKIGTMDCKIDFLRRFDFMQQHSGEHIVSGIAHSLYGCENVGFHLGENIVTLDFDKPLSNEQLDIIEQKANEKVYECVKFNTYYPDKKALEALEYRSKKELLGDIRIVRIENTDVCACCAPHVKNAGQIGIIKFVSRESYKGGVRLELKCGKRALSDYETKHKNALEIGKILCVKPYETADAVSKLYAQNSDLKYALNGYKREAVLKFAEEYSPCDYATAVFFDGLEIKELCIASDALYKKCGGIRGAFSENNGGFGFSVCGAEAELDGFFSEFKNRFSVKGGGRNGMVQGTVFGEKSELSEFFKKYLSN